MNLSARPASSFIWSQHIRITHKFMARPASSFIWYDPFMCNVNVLLALCCMDTMRSYVAWIIRGSHDSFIFDMTYSCVPLMSHMTWLIDVWHDAFIWLSMTWLIDYSCVPWLSHMTWLIDVWHDAFMCEISRVPGLVLTKCVPMWHNSFVCDLTHSCVKSVVFLGTQRIRDLWVWTWVSIYLFLFFLAFFFLIISFCHKFDMTHFVKYETEWMSHVPYEWMRHVPYEWMSHVTCGSMSHVT